MTQAKPMSIPMTTNVKLSKDDQPKIIDEQDEMSKVPYKQAVEEPLDGCKTNLPLPELHQGHRLDL